jgi:group II intron reverse transcriptase/maturase
MGPDVLRTQSRFRPQRSAHQAVAQAQQYIADGNHWVVDLDLKKFFDRVNHDKLMAAIARRVSDNRMLRLIRAFLKSGVMENGLVSPVEEGTPQGGPLSPLLSNLVLDELDRELERRQHRFVRYADDCNIYVASERAGRRVTQNVTSFIRRRLQLKVNETKSAVARPQERKFLGFSFTGGKEPRRRIAPQALLRCQRRVRELTRRTRGISLPDDEGTGQLPAWLERLLRLLPDALGAARARSVDTATIAIRDLEAKEATQFMAAREQSRSEHDVSQRLLRLTRSSTLGRGVT